MRKAWAGREGRPQAGPQNNGEKEL